MALMGQYWKLVVVCTVLWTVVGAMAVGGAVRNDTRVLLLAVLVALVACMVSGWLIALCAATVAVTRGRIELETLAEIMASCAADRTVERIR